VKVNGATRRAHITTGELAWTLVEAVRSELDVANRTAVFVELGCGDDVSAIHRILSAATCGSVALPGSLLRITDEWLDRYHGVAHEPELRDLVRRAHRLQTSADDPKKEKSHPDQALAITPRLEARTSTRPNKRERHQGPRG
jgi:hypothetical protein